MLDANWTCQGSSFLTTLRVFDLPHYDMILGMDWLEQCGKMWVDWPKKVLRFWHNGSRITLKGVRTNLKKCDVILAAELHDFIEQDALAHVMQLSAMSSVPAVATKVPPVIARVLDRHASCFQEPKGLPPHRSYDHQINLVLGAPPVNVKPYRYTPQQKDEIERQIRDMLATGIIHPSQSPFASSVLLVKKKDGTWRLCVDYR